MASTQRSNRSSIDSDMEQASCLFPDTILSELDLNLPSQSSYRDCASLSQTYTERIDLHTPDDCGVLCDDDYKADDELTTGAFELDYSDQHGLPTPATLGWSLPDGFSTEDRLSNHDNGEADGIMSEEQSRSAIPEQVAERDGSGVSSNSTNILDQSGLAMNRPIGAGKQSKYERCSTPFFGDLDSQPISRAESMHAVDSWARALKALAVDQTAWHPQPSPKVLKDIWSQSEPAIEQDVDQRSSYSGAILSAIGDYTPDQTESANTLSSTCFEGSSPCYGPRSNDIEDEPAWLKHVKILNAQARELGLTVTDIENDPSVVETETEQEYKARQGIDSATRQSHTSQKARELLHELDEQPIPDIAHLMNHRLSSYAVLEDIVSLRSLNPKYRSDITWTAEKRRSKVAALKRYWEIKALDDD